MWSCGRVWSACEVVCEVVFVPYVEAVVLWLRCVYCCLCCICVCWKSARVRWWRKCWCGAWGCSCGECGVWVNGWYTWFRFCAYCRLCARDECSAWGERYRWSLWNVYMFGSWRGTMCGRCVGENIGFRLYQSCRNRGSVGRVSVYSARLIPANLRFTQCSIMLHLFDICLQTCICLW